MNSFLRAAALSIVVAVSGSMVVAQDFEKGLTAYQAGDYETALKEWQPLADQGDAQAQYNLALMYDTGEGVAKDYAEAARWYRLAAEQGDASAQYNLARKYFVGEGVLKDPTSAHMWLNIASANGDESASKKRDDIEKEMTPEQIADATERAKVCMSSDYEDCD